jgi:hypothetical protein
MPAVIGEDGGRGMKGVDTIARIRREPFVRGKTIKEIARELHVSWNTVRKVLRSGASAFEDAREVQPRPKLGPWKDELDRMIDANESRPARERLTLKRQHEPRRVVGNLITAEGGGFPPAVRMPRSPCRPIRRPERERPAASPSQQVLRTPIYVNCIALDQAVGC